jgi:hypothetical protein
MSNIMETMNKVANFQSLPKGWSFGEGVPLSNQNFRRGLVLLTLADIAQIGRTDASLGDDGELQLIFNFNTFSAAFTLETDGTASVTIDKRGKIISQYEGLSDKQAASTLWEMVQNVELTLESSISAGGTKENFDLVAPPSSRRLVRVTPKRVSQSLKFPVRKQTAVLPAPTLENTMQESGEFPPFCGTYQTNSFHRVLI